MLDGDLPETDDADMERAGRVLNQATQTFRQDVRAPLDDRDEDMGVEQQPHSSGGSGCSRKSSGSGASKSSAMKKVSPDGYLRLNSAIASRRRPTRGRCGTRSSTGRPLRVTITVSPPSTRRASWVSRFLASRIETMVMQEL